MLLYIKHIDIEGPATLGEFFKHRGFASRTIEMTARDNSFPDSLDDIEAVVSLGGPMNVYEEKKYSFLREENTFIQRVLTEEIPFMGLCLGSQLLAKAANARVGRSPEQEIGFSTVQLSPQGQGDPLFKGVSAQFPVFQWHEDMWELPPGSQWLAASKACPHQAFRLGQNAYGLQFHVEITDKSIREWAQEYFKDNDPDKSKKIQQMIDEYFDKKKEFDAVAQTIYTNFLKIIWSHKVSV
jgi:GMP synthase-like glutamine amidotransferase